MERKEGSQAGRWKGGQRGDPTPGWPDRQEDSMRAATVREVHGHTDRRTQGGCGGQNRAPQRCPGARPWCRSLFAVKGTSKKWQWSSEAIEGGITGVLRLPPTRGITQVFPVGVRGEGKLLWGSALATPEPGSLPPAEDVGAF